MEEGKKDKVNGRRRGRRVESGGRGVGRGEERRERGGEKWRGVMNEF